HRSSRMDLNPDYYLRNFEHVLAHAVASSGSVFSDEERDCLARFAAAPRPARMLFARLYLRRGPTFRLSRLEYPEIGDVRLALEALEAAGFAVCSTSSASDPTAEACLSTLTCPEMRA